MSTHEIYSELRLPLVDGDKSPAEVTEDVCRPLEGKGGWPVVGRFSDRRFGSWRSASRRWPTFMATGVGVWGLNRTVGLGFRHHQLRLLGRYRPRRDLISAVLFLFRQRWRTAVNRSAEAMTIFAVMCAGIFPLIHMGRPWLAFFVFPLPQHPRAAVDQLPLGPVLGRVRDLDLLPDLARLLVHRP